MTRWLGNGADVLFSEFGLPTKPVGGASVGSAMLVDEHVAAEYTDRALRNVRAAGASGAMLWCANDYVPAVWGDAPFDHAIHERHFGLWRSDGSPKPAVDIIARYRTTENTALHDDLSWIDVEPGEFFTPTGSHAARLYARYRAQRG